MAYAPIADYALIGDCHSAALVRRDGSIDWACLQRFDSSAVFCGLLDDKKGGAFTLAARNLERIERRYLPGTNVLETTFHTATGRARLIDCFTVREGGRQRPYKQLLRIVEGVAGEVELDVCVEPRFDYGSLHPWLTQHRRERVFSAVGGNDAFVLSTDCDLEIDRERIAIVGVMRVKPRQRRRLSLVAAEPHELDLRHLSAPALDLRLRKTIAWWRRWTARCRFDGEYRQEVLRSALVLKLLTCAPTGAIIAAPTTSLPERIGGVRNWDYRYSWVRDATMTLGALLDIGHPEVATGFKAFIERATAGHADELQIMYGCYGERRLPELELGHLEGYRGSQPVRIGNGAATQTQLDVYGELMDAAHLWRGAGNPINDDGWRFMTSLVEAAIAEWQKPDNGLWEMRGDPQHFVYSKVMCWLAVDRGVEAAEATDRSCDLERWRKAREEIRASIEAHGVDPERGCFVQAYGSKELDASLLRLPLVGFVTADDPRMRKTVQAIREQLTVDGLVCRYRAEKGDDGIGGGEGTFLMASFWLVDVLTMQGELDEAEALFRRLLQLCNDLGLYSEEHDARTGELLGNFPQAFTHVALITTAAQLRRAHAQAGECRPIAERKAVSRHRVKRSTPHHHAR